MRIRTLFLATLALVAAGAASAQNYLDLGQIRGLPETPTVQVDLNPMMLGLASSVSRTANPAAADLLANVEGVRVRVYSSLVDVGAVMHSIDEVSTQLTQSGWQQIVRVQDGGDVRVLMQASGEAITGLTAMIVEGDEAVFVNLVGSLTPEQLAQFMQSTGMAEALAALGQFNAQP
jgi:hypothetical protein